MSIYNGVMTLSESKVFRLPGQTIIHLPAWLPLLPHQLATLTKAGLRDGREPLLELPQRPVAKCEAACDSTATHTTGSYAYPTL